ncbi:MAG: glycoside hydrolase family 57 protein [Pseudomonadota bacterium]
MEKAGDKVQLLFIWHMHQPDYYDPEHDEVVLPWVRLHGCMGYTDMPYHMAAYPDIKATFNFSGTLLRELRGAASDNRKDRYASLTLKAPEELAYEEKVYILKHFFSLSPYRIKSSDRMFQLLRKRGRIVSESAITGTVKDFSNQDFLDLQVLFNLLWFGRGACGAGGRIEELKKKGKDFNDADKEQLLQCQKDVCSKILDSYVELNSKGRIEISVTPHFHPILPLLLDSDQAAEGLPGAALPEKFSAPEDARWHVEEALAEHEAAFGVRPAGMWPAEGSVCESMMPLLDELGVKWIGTDEGVLWRSMRASLHGSPGGRESFLYRPYRLNSGNTAVFFRDHYLSDRVGFTYQSMKSGPAVDDFISYLEQISRKDRAGTPVVTVILDGENPWSYYPDDGASFLSTLYERLSKETWIETTTPSALLEEPVPCGELASLFPGSWIDSNFRIWIGDHAKNLAWKQLAAARSAVLGAGCDEPARERAMSHIRVAEGSDWFWWYGEPNSSTEDPIFDQIFRSRLRMAMVEAGLEIPVALMKPTGKKARPAPVLKTPLTFINPGVDGTGEKYFEWYNAGKYEIRQATGEMAGAPPLFSSVYYGFDYDFIYIRMDPLATPSRNIEERLLGVDVRVVFDEASEKWIEVSLPSPPAARLHAASGGSEGIKVAFERILEVAVPIALFELGRGSLIKLNFFVMRDNIFVERYPDQGYFEITVPDENWDHRQWIV